MGCISIILTPRRVPWGFLYLDRNSYPVVRYVYDAWGKHKVYDGAGVIITASDHIGLSFS